MCRAKPRQLPFCISQVCVPSPPRHDPTNDPVGERRHSELHNPVIPVFLQLRANQTPHFPCFVSPSTHYHSRVSRRKTEVNMHHSIASGRIPCYFVPIPHHGCRALARHDVWKLADKVACSSYPKWLQESECLAIASKGTATAPCGGHAARLHGYRPAHPINRHIHSTSTHSRCAWTRAEGTPMCTLCH